MSKRNDKSNRGAEVLSAVADASDEHLKSVDRTAAQQNALAARAAKNGPLTSKDYRLVKRNVK